jgi:hypothetical protein
MDWPVLIAHAEIFTPDLAAWQVAESKKTIAFRQGTPNRREGTPVARKLSEHSIGMSRGKGCA